MTAEPEARENDEPPAEVVHSQRDHEQLESAAEANETKNAETDEFGLPVKSPRRPAASSSNNTLEDGDGDTFHDALDGIESTEGDTEAGDKQETANTVVKETEENRSANRDNLAPQADESTATSNVQQASVTDSSAESVHEASRKKLECGDLPVQTSASREENQESSPTEQPLTPTGDPAKQKSTDQRSLLPETAEGIKQARKANRRSGNAVSEWSHQRLAPQEEPDEEEDEEGDNWQDMTALGTYDIYDDDGKLVARGATEQEDDSAVYAGLGGAGKGYTRVQIDEDAQSATSMDEDTKYLFKEVQPDVLEGDEEQRDPLAQLQATKDLLTEGQRIAYVGVTRLVMFLMVQDLESIEGTKNTKKELRTALESMKKWGQQMMVRLYAHMEIDSAEQIMIEQLAEHGVQPADLVPPLMQNSRVKNPLAEDSASPGKSVSSPNPSADGEASRSSVSLASEKSPPLKSDDLPEVRTPSQMPNTEKIDLDLRWTVLCDLFLVLIADSAYDARSRLLLERVAEAMDISWVHICRFEKRVIDALEMQEAANKETWNEADHMETRRKMALKRKYLVMGLATVGGSLVIGLSAGLLAPVIGAGLAAGFTTIGVTGTGAFLGGVGGAALITSGAAVTGGTIAVRASHRRTGAVKTFEYRPLHNNKRVNLIVTVSGWMNGKIDDVRLPYSTVDPIMGDIYSVLWEPEMLQSMGDTINILATEALTQGLQQILGSTVLVALMASLQLPIVLTKLSYLIDNPWTVSLDRANSAGLIMADSLIDRNLGHRPITLLGFSLGARMIFSCLKELANKGAYGMIQNVYLFGSPIVAKKDEYLRARSVVSGRFVNGYASNDWILGYLFRATSGGIMRVAGLAPVEDIPGLENLDVTQLVNGHMAYRAAMPRLLREVGWEVESDEFTEIEDPDPENHQKRQRELIREIDEARKEAEAKPEKKRFAFFKRGKLAEKKGWEMYENQKGGDARSSNENFGGANGAVLFDIDAIRRELESEQIEVKQLESTLPPMRLDLGGGPSTGGNGTSSPYSNLRQTKSSDASLSTQQKPDANSSEQSLPNGRAAQPVEAPLSSLPTLDGQKPAVNGEENMQMTFDTSFDQPRQITKPSIPEETLQPRDITPPRPELKSSVTMPTAGLSTLNLEHNAWADEDEEFGKEKEITMTFG